MMNATLSYKVDEYINQMRYPLINSVLLYKNGELIIERYYNRFTENSRNNIKSIWKSILSICTGICLDKGLIGSLDDPIGQYLPEFNGSNQKYHQMMTIRTLLTMTSGIYWNGGIHYHCPMLEQLFRTKNWVSYLADIQMKDLPGTHFVYKEWDVILLSAVISRATKMDTFDFCNEYLYKPLGIEGGSWWKSACGVAYNIGPNEGEQAKSDLTAKDLAKIGFLFLNKGIYEGKQILSSDYIEEATSPSPCYKGYGYMWWLFDGGYGGRGYGGQEVNVIPSKDIVYVMQAKATAKGKCYNDVFEYIINELNGGE